MVSCGIYLPRLSSSPAAVCQNNTIIPVAYQKYYFPLNVSNGLMCVSNCSIHSPYGPFCKAGEQCYLGAQGPQCR